MSRFFVLILLTLVTQTIFAQRATVKGVILDENNQPVPNVNIVADGEGTQSNRNGFYSLSILANKNVVLTFSHISFKKVVLRLTLTDGEDYEFNPVLKVNIEQIDEVVVSSKGRKTVEGIVNISPEQIRLIPGANAGVENILKSLPGVNSNNELSTQYSVRGGNFDENLVYVNEIEVYRPFLIRSGQQEGFSFVNSDLVQNVDFSAGGFQAKYGDKLSSVLDITYKTPVSFGASLNLSLLGGSASVETVSGDGKLSTITGIRYRDNSLLVNSRQTETNFTPAFGDIQSLIKYKFSSKFHLSLLGNFSINDYDFQPISRQTNFGTIDEPIALLVVYEGQEQDQYITTFGAFKANYFVNEDLTLKLIGSAYHTLEEEHFDILAQYRLGEVNSNIGDQDLGEVEFSEGVGSQFTHARNDLDALIFNLEHKANLVKNGNQIDWGVKYTHEDIRDRLREFEVIDSAGFSIRPPFPDFDNDQPFEPFDAPLEAFQSRRATNFTKIDRVSAYLQWSRRTYWGENEIWMNAGVRAQNWTVSGENIDRTSQTVVSPRVQFALKPNWNKDMLFRLAGGFYHQPPFYRELRDPDGVVQPGVKAQQSIHVVLGNDYSFRLWDRPFKLTTEAYYKSLSDVNIYTLENVRIRYRANNDARAFAYGLDLRLNGEFVPGTESWLSIGYLKTEENSNNTGYIARPTDQRLKVAVLFQDYVPKIPDLKMYLNLVYNTGLPTGSPGFEDPAEFQNRLRDFRRADLGISYVLADRQKQFGKGHWLNKFKELNLGFEIYNLFDNRNAITSTFVRDVNTRRQFSVPNFLTGRVFNIKLGMRF
ncbi:TonB-dependent receptor plug domain-containing protein [Leptobacterium flavescens]|uniref:TonB-dependent receptor plug domain-containing protein n=1 Tax=Leptobacterium flavescens TaxID=472055 RepID=A0A6P0UQB5_9FLAO|nr:carboxypeptidase-like regulatory domain-containing protein [Leptobacterium flavescens]NER14178.1 TonB-dependent receptor plug domain-containing protein [Leptobacterium flavescens]